MRHQSKMWTHIRIILQIALFSICWTLLTTTLSLEAEDAHSIASPQINLDYTHQQLNYNHTNFNRTKNIWQLLMDHEAVRRTFTLLRRLSMNAHNTYEPIFREHRRLGKAQDIVAKTEPFPCDVRDARSPTPPTSVHRLRPGDIDIVAVIGDSGSCGNGAISTHYMHIVNEFRGISFAGGGMADWRTYLTLPNILKLFNPRLYGYSIANELTIDPSSRLNIAEPMLMSRDFVPHALKLIERMRHDPHVNMTNHWKLLTVYLGNNDMCMDSCLHDNITEFIKIHEHDLREGFTILRDNVPRLLVNLISLPNLIKVLYLMRNRPLVCSMVVHPALCYCVFNDNLKGEQLQEVAQTIKHWNDVDKYVASLPEFQTDDFAVLHQPFLTETKPPQLPNGDTDLRYFSSDCFHLSQLGHAAMANALWNNMLQPEGHKQLEMVPIFERFECPNAERPYIVTPQNAS